MMHYLPTAFRVLLILNVLGTAADVVTAWRRGPRRAFHWLIPKLVGWALLLWAVLPVRWGGAGLAHFEAIVLSALALVLYGVLIWATDVSRAPLPWITFEAPHVGTVGPPHLLALPLLLLAIVALDVLRHGRLSGDDIVFLVGAVISLVFFVRYGMRLACVTSLKEFLALLWPLRPNPRPTGAKYHMSRGEEDEE